MRILGWLGGVVLVVGVSACNCGGGGEPDSGHDASVPATLAWPLGATLEVTSTTASTATLNWPAALGPVAKYRFSADGASRELPMPGASIDSLVVGHHVAVSVVAVGSDGTQTPPLRAEVGGADPLNVPTGDISTDFCGANAFAQKGETIPCDDFAVIVGHVRTRDGSGVPGMRIGVLSHPEWGEAVSQADGLYAIGVKSGLQTVTLSSDSFIHIQRNVIGRAGDFIYVPDTVVLRRDEKSTAILLPAGGFHEATTQQDRDGQRTSSIFIPSGTHGWLRFADGGTEPLSTVTLRATEATVGEAGAQAMPGSLPSSTAYTFAADISADEAVAVDALGVGFDGKVAFYTNNYLNYPVGVTMPLGSYDETKGAWESLESATVIEVAASGVTPAIELLPGEGQMLAQRFAPGTQLVRNLTTHFSTMDTNGGFACDGSCAAAGSAEVAAHEPHCDGECGSLIRVQNRTLSEYTPIAGTGLMLGWHSNRGQVRQAGVDMSLPGLDDGGIPTGLAGTRFQLNVAGRIMIDERPDGGPGDRVRALWDGTDAFGRKVRGPVPALASTAFGYRGVAKSAPRDAGVTYAFGVWPNKDSVSVSPTRMAVFFERKRKLQIGDWVPRENIGNFSLDILHGYSNHSTLHLGNGVDFSSSNDPFVRKIAGGGPKYIEQLPDAGVNDVQLWDPRDLVGDDTNVYYSDAKQVIVRISGDHMAILSGAYSDGFAGDGQPAAVGRFAGISGLAVDPAGNLYIADANNYRIRKIDAATGLLSTIIGNGTQGYSPDGTDALTASLDKLQAIFFGVDGKLYFMTNSPGGLLIRHVEQGKLVTNAGGGGLLDDYHLEDTSPFAVNFDSGGGTHYAAQGPDGSIYVMGYDNGDSTRTYIVRRIWPDGHVSIVIGNGESDDPDEPVAVNTCIGGFFGLTVGIDGVLYVGESGSTGCSLRRSGIRAVLPDGSFLRFQGGYSLAPYTQIPPDGPVSTQPTNRITRVGRRANGNLLFMNAGSPYTLHEVVLQINQQTIASPDGEEVYVFDLYGRHLKTISARTGLTVWQFEWTDAGLASITDVDGDVTHIERDGSGVATAFVAPDGQRTSLQIDSSGRITRLTDSEGREVRPAYFDNGLLKEWRDENGHSTTFEWDEAGNLSSETNARGAKKQLLGDAQNVTLVSAVGRQTLFAREASEGRSLMTNTQPDGTQTTRLYLGAIQKTVAADGTTTDVQLQGAPSARFGGTVELPGDVTVKTPSGLSMVSSSLRTATSDGGVFGVGVETQTTKINGKTWASKLDVANKTYSSTTPAGRTASMTLNDKLRPLIATQPGLLPITYTYDARGRISSVSRGARSETFTYGSNGALESVKNALNETTFFTTDSTGRVTKVTRADAKEVLQSQDPVGNLTSVTPADSQTHSYSYNEVNDVTSYTPPSVTPPTQPETTSYDLDGLVTTTGHSDGTSTTTTREPSGRVTSVASPWWTNSFTYLASGQLQTATRGAQTLAWAYDGFLTKTETANGVVSGWAYDTEFRVTSHSIGDAGIGFAYDNDSLLIGAGAANLSRNPDSGFLTAVTVGTVATTFGYNGYGEVESVTSGSLYSEGLQYDSAGRLTVIQETVNGMPAQYAYTYDAIGRLKSATKDGTQTTTWTYDGNGNRLTENGTQSTFDAQDRLLTKGTTTYTWDALGGRKTKTEGGQTTQYTHDGLGALLSVTLPDSTAITYEYDARQRRVAKRRNGTVEARWVYDGQYRVAAQLDASGNVTHRFVYGSQLHSPDYVVTGGVTYAYVKNHLGSIRFVVNASTSAVAQQLDYDAWGNLLSDSAPGFQPFAFAGGFYDRDTKLTHFGFRDYDALAGVWMAKDALRLGGGMGVYAYALSGPTLYVDPSGLRPMDPPPSLEREWASQVPRTPRDTLADVNSAVDQIECNLEYSDYGPILRGLIADGKIKMGERGLSETMRELTGSTVNASTTFGVITIFSTGRTGSLAETLLHEYLHLLNQEDWSYESFSDNEDDSPTTIIEEDFRSAYSSDRHHRPNDSSRRCVCVP